MNVPVRFKVPASSTVFQYADRLRVFGLGCMRAVSLDGGVSAQLMLQTNARRQVWRSVP